MIGEFSDINQQLLTQNIKDFFNLDFREISEYEIGKALSKILFQNQSSERRYFEMYINFNNPDKDKLFRVRRNISSLSEVIFDENNFWCLPKEKIKQGRLNNNNEQILYASFDRITAFLETGVKKNEKFLVIEYKIKNSIELKCIQMDGRFGKDNVIAQIYNDFFNDIMMISEEEKPGIYKVSNYIKDVFFHLNNFDGWYYVSAQNKKLKNVALIYPKIKDHIKIKSLKIVELYDDSSCLIHEQAFFE